MQQYLDFLKFIRAEGTVKKDRTGVGTISVFGYDMRFDISRAYPLVTTKKIHLPSMIHELLWFLSGNTNVKYLQENGVRIWNAWADDNGDLGPVYGHQWRSWSAADGRTIDQISDVIKMIKENPHSRRLIVNAWNVGELDKMALPPCHMMFQFYVADNKLSCKLTQRSADAFLGVPFNIASYSLLTAMIAQVCDLGLGEFIWSGGDCHIYLNHLEQVDEQLGRECLGLPTLKLNPDISNIFDFKYEDITIENYQHHPAIKAPIAV